MAALMIEASNLGRDLASPLLRSSLAMVLLPMILSPWLYVSRLQPQISREAIRNKLSGTLSVDGNKFKCVKLVPGMPDPTFISSKLGMIQELLQRSHPRIF
jgi:hypothetical protein